MVLGRIRDPEALRLVRLGADGALEVDATSGQVMAGIPLARIDRGAPSRIVQALRARFGVAREDIEYLSLNSDGWYVLLLAEDAYRRPLAAGGAVLNGAGECTGFLSAAEWGLVETPVYLTRAGNNPGNHAPIGPKMIPIASSAVT